uniref:Uncharacterized protein n=1 Tax=Caenorhabditis japonica TaxID=281687 RepID=A0A8R1IB24_CAEJA
MTFVDVLPQAEVKTPRDTPHKGSRRLQTYPVLAKIPSATSHKCIATAPFPDETTDSSEVSTYRTKKDGFGIKSDGTPVSLDVARRQSSGQAPANPQEDTIATSQFNASRSSRHAASTLRSHTKYPSTR